MVTNGSVSTCLDGDFRPANPGVVLWEEFSLGRSNEQQMVQFSSYLHSMNSLVSSVVCVVWVCVVCGCDCMVRLVIVILLFRVFFVAPGFFLSMATANLMQACVCCKPTIVKR